MFSARTKLSTMQGQPILGQISIWKLWAIHHSSWIFIRSRCVCWGVCRIFTIFNASRMVWIKEETENTLKSSLKESMAKYPRINCSRAVLMMAIDHLTLYTVSCMIKSKLNEATNTTHMHLPMDVYTIVLYAKRYEHYWKNRNNDTWKLWKASAVCTRETNLIFSPCYIMWENGEGKGERGSTTYRVTSFV